MRLRTSAPSSAKLFAATHRRLLLLAEFGRSVELSVHRPQGLDQRWSGTAPDPRALGGRLEVGRRLTQHVSVWRGQVSCCT